MNLESKDLVQLLKDNPDLANMWHRLHTPLIRQYKKVNRNDICPFCNSGKKFKTCTCYTKYTSQYINEK